MNGTSPEVAFLAGAFLSAVFFGFIAFAVGLDRGRRHHMGVTPTVYVGFSRSLALSLVANRIQQLLERSARRVPKKHLAKYDRTALIEQHMTLPEHCEYRTLQDHWLALRDPNAESAIAALQRIDPATARAIEDSHPL